MTTERVLIATAFSALLLAAQANAAPGSGGAGGANQGGGPGGGKPRTEQPAKSMDRTETKTREQLEQNNPGKGDQVRERSEETQQIRDEASGKGQATSAEMQERQQERKEIQDQYRTADQTGNKAGKKPWWKFWESDAS
jgi:flagellar motility protein MotE (MotC chaperone)